MPEKKPVRCAVCEHSITPKTLGRANYSRLRPLCIDCEEEALRTRPSPRDRKQQGEQQR